MSTHDSINEKAHQFLHEHSLGVLSTTSDGQPWGSAIYFVTDDYFNFYFITRADTKKYQNIKSHPNAALTVVDSKSQVTVQASGVVTRVPPDKYHDVVFRKLASLRPKGDPDWAPPVIKVHRGDYMVLKFQTTHLQYADFLHKRPDVDYEYIKIVVDNRDVSVS